MKELTRKQKLQFIEFYMEDPWVGMGTQYAHICISLNKFVPNDCGIDVLPWILFPELLWFNRIKSNRMATFETDNISADELRFTVISFLKAIIENP